jgi:hypothetical protein
MNLPRGDPVYARVVEGAGVALAETLDRELTGYALLSPGDALLSRDGDRGVLTFEDGVPVLAYHPGTDRGGPPALADLDAPGPVRVELFATPAEALAPAHDADPLRVPPGRPAERLADDPALAERTRERAPDGRVDDEADPVAAFLDDDEALAAIREQARAEARERADEWGLTEQLDDGA